MIGGCGAGFSTIDGIGMFGVFFRRAANFLVAFLGTRCAVFGPTAKERWTAMIIEFFGMYRCMSANDLQNNGCLFANPEN